jgi:hypothetical protein
MGRDLFRYVDTVTDLADASDEFPRREQLSKDWIHREGWPPKTARGWDVLACLEFYRDAKIKERDNKGGNGTPADPQLAKLNRVYRQRQIDKLEVQIATLKGELVDRVLMREAMTELLRIVKAAGRGLQESIEADIADPVIVQKCREIIGRMLRHVKERIADEQDTPEDTDAE